ATPDGGAGVRGAGRGRVLHPGPHAGAAGGGAAATRRGTPGPRPVSSGPGAAAPGGRAVPAVLRPGGRSPRPDPEARGGAGLGADRVLSGRPGHGPGPAGALAAPRCPSTALASFHPARGCVWRAPQLLWRDGLVGLGLCRPGAAVGTGRAGPGPAG